MGLNTVAILKVSDASRMAGVSLESMCEKIVQGELKRTPEGIELNELIRVYPSLKPLSNLKLREVKKRAQDKVDVDTTLGAILASDDAIASVDDQRPEEAGVSESAIEQTKAQFGTVELLIRELEWNKELLEQTNQLMAKQLADQRALIADQARRLDEKDRFWARQIEIAQSLLPAPAAAPVARKKFLGIF